MPGNDRCLFIDGHCDLSCDFYHARALEGIRPPDLGEGYKADMCEGPRFGGCQLYQGLMDKVTIRAIRELHEKVELLVF